LVYRDLANSNDLKWQIRSADPKKGGPNKNPALLVKQDGAIFNGCVGSAKAGRK
jgi:hypothetical protein